MTASVPPGCTADRWEEFARFADALVATGDLDPASVLLRALADEWDLDTEGRIRLVFLWIAFDHTASVLHFWERHGFPDHRAVPADLLRLPTSMERRGHRSPRALQRHLEALGARDSWSRLLVPLLDARTPRASWRAVIEAVAGIPGNGRWSSFKAGEMLVEVAGFPMDAPDCQHGNSSGPRTGLGLLIPETAAFVGNDPETLLFLDQRTEDVRAGLEVAGGYKVPLHQVESILCDYQGLRKGRYWLGHDIQLQHDELVAARFLSDDMRTAAFAARARAFPGYLRAEDGALDGHDPKHLAATARDGRLIWWDPPTNGLGPGRTPIGVSAAKIGGSEDTPGHGGIPQ